MLPPASVADDQFLSDSCHKQRSDPRGWRRLFLSPSFSRRGTGKRRTRDEKEQQKRASKSPVMKGVSETETRHQNVPGAGSFLSDANTSKPQIGTAFPDSEQSLSHRAPLLSGLPRETSVESTTQSRMFRAKLCEASRKMVIQTAPIRKIVHSPCAGGRTSWYQRGARGRSEATYVCGALPSRWRDNESKEPPRRRCGTLHLAAYMTSAVVFLARPGARRAMACDCCRVPGICSRGDFLIAAVCFASARERRDKKGAAPNALDPLLFIVASLSRLPSGGECPGSFSMARFFWRQLSKRAACRHAFRRVAGAG